MTDTRAALGKRINHFRMKSGYTQEQLCEYADLSQNFLSQLENGKKNASIDTLFKIAGALKTDPQHFLTGGNGGKKAEQPLIDARLQAHIGRLSKKEKNLLLNFLKTFHRYK
jgi:transcriptional regulator with XRE-family HTH domain